MKLQMILTSGLITLFSATALASGGSSGGFSSGTTSFERQIDQTYETGKAIYLGRQSGSPKISYCVTSGDEVVKVKTSSVRDYKKTTYENFATNLYNCDEPSNLVAHQLSEFDFAHVLYYLNERYNLSLVDNS